MFVREVSCSFTCSLIFSLGIQFHPESVATYYGKQIFKNFAKITKDYWVGLRPSISERKADYAGNFSMK